MPIPHCAWFGYTPDPDKTAAFVASIPKVYGDQLDDLPYDLDASAPIYRHLAECLKGSTWVDGEGRLHSQNQGNHGSCVGHGTSVACDVTAACDIKMRREPEVWPLHPVRKTPVRSAPDWLYGASRDISGTLARWQGSFGSAAAQLVRDWGVLHQIPYGDIDLTSYSARRCDLWDTAGVPRELVEASRNHPFSATVQIRTVEQAVGLIQNGYGWNICSSLGFSQRRGRDGFAKRQGSWAHSMAVIGYMVVGRRRGFVIQNSWGDNWNGGPWGTETPDLPHGAFLADASIIEGAIRGGDCFAYGGYQGFAASPFDWSSFG